MEFAVRSSTYTTMKSACDGPLHVPHTRGTRFPGDLPRYRIYQIVPLATHF